MAPLQHGAVNVLNEGRGGKDKEELRQRVGRGEKGYEVVDEDFD